MRFTCQKLQAASFILLFFTLFILSYTGYSQSGKTFQGIVTDEKGVPLEGVSVTIKGSGHGVSTKADGTFSITSNTGTTVTLSSIGRTSKDVVLRGNGPLKVQLESLSSTLNDVVVVGYGSVRKKDLTGSVAVVDVKDAKKTASYDVAKMLQGQVAGVTVQSSGEPGSFVQLKIRGTSTFGDNAPLFVIDGVPLGGPFDFSPDDIESIQILKDASSAAIYGSRALGGVVIITTKKGKNGPLKINYSGYVGMQNVPKTIAVTDRAGYQKITSAAELNAGLTVAPANNPANPAYISTVNTDWQKEAFKTGIITDHNLSLSGGNDAAAYNVGLSYFNQSSTYTGPQNYRRYSLNANLTGKKGIFSYGTKIALTQSHKVNPFNAVQYHAIFGGSVTSVLTAIPTMPVYDPAREGGYGGSDAVTQRAITLNVVGLNSLINNYSDRNRLLGNFWGELELAKNFKYRLNVSYDRSDFKNFGFEPTYDLGFYYKNTNSYMFQQNGYGYRALAENTLTYNATFGNHKLDLLGGYIYEYDYDESVSASAINLPQPYFYTFSSVTDPASKGIGSGSGANAIISYLGRINYNYNDRYLVTASVRRDGSSLFSPAHRYGNFPSVAASWNVHNEKFIHLPSFISTLKLRGGYGVVGSQGAGRYAYEPYVNTAASYVFGNTMAPGTTTIAIVDNQIKWETKKTTNVALDMNLLHDRLSVTAEYYNNKSSDLLTSISTTLYVGSVPASIYTNAASMQNKGFELSATYHGGNGKFKYDVNGNITTVKNNVLQLGGTNNPLYGAASKTEVGRSVGEIFGFVTEGLFQNEGDITKHATQLNAKPGDVKFKDVNGDGTITDNDRVYLGTTIPKLNYGFNFAGTYDNFDFSVFLQGNAGNKVYNGVYRDLMTEQYGNHSVDALNFWTPTNTNTNVPRPVILDPNQNLRNSDRFVESGSYVKLQNAQIGYTVPAAKLAATKVISSVHVYVSGQNLITFSKYKGYDPDFVSDGLLSRGYDYGSFPNPRAFLFGVQVGF